MKKLIIIQSAIEDTGLQNALEILCKLSEASQTKEILWRTAPTNGDGRSATETWRLHAGHLQKVELDHQIAQAGALTSIDIFTTCSSSLDAPNQSRLSTWTNQLTTHLEGLIPPTTVVRDKRLFFPIFGQLRPSGDFFQVINCTNFVVIPEDREHPATVAFPLTTSSTSKYSWHVAGELLSLAGLWTTMENHLLESIPPSAGGQIAVHLVRSFARSAVSAYHSADVLLNESLSLPLPVGKTLLPNPLKAIKECALDAYPDEFSADNPHPFSPRQTTNNRQLIALVTRRVFTDIIHLPQTAKNGIRSELDEATTEVAQSLIGQHSWLQATGKSLLPASPDKETENDSTESASEDSDLQEVIDQISMAVDMEDLTVNHESWDKVLYTVLGTIDGSEANSFHQENAVVVNRLALASSPQEETLENAIESLGGLPEELTHAPNLTTEETKKTQSPQENLLSLISTRFSTERKRVHESAVTSLELLQNIASPASRDISGVSRAIKICFFGSIALALIAIATLIAPIRDLLALQGIGATTRMSLFVFFSAIISIPVGLLFLPDEDHKSRLYLVALLTSIAGITTLLIIKAKPWGDEIYTHESLRWFVAFLLSSAIIFLIIVGLQKTASISSGWTYLARRSLFVLGPVYGISMYILGFNQKDPQWEFAKWVIDEDTTFLAVALVVSLVSFFSSAAIVSISKIQDEKRLNVYKAESTYLTQKAEDAIRYREALAQLHIEWLGTASVLQRLINHPFGDAEKMDIRTAFNPIGSEDILKYRTITLSLTTDGTDAFFEDAIPALSPAGWLTASYRLTRDAFLSDRKANTSGDLPPEHCTYPWSPPETVFNKDLVKGRGTRWPFTHTFYEGGLDEDLRSVADKKLEEVILNTFLNVENSWKSDAATGETPALSTIFEEIAPSLTGKAQFSMGMFGENKAKFSGSKEMETLFAWPDNVDVPEETSEPTFRATHKNVNNSIIFQAVRLDISDPIAIDELGPAPIEGGSSGSRPDDPDDNRPLFGR